MANVFTAFKDYVQQPKRNTFDLSFQNNLTMNFGNLYPVFCKEVVPGDSFRITPTFGLRFMPLVFPVQTRMNANLHFFYVRNRNIWKDWPDFIGRTKPNLIMPYLSPSVAKEVCKTGALGDYFGAPTTLAGDFGSRVTYADRIFVPNSDDYYVFGTYTSGAFRTFPVITGASGAPMNGKFNLAAATSKAFMTTSQHPNNVGIVTPELDLSTLRTSTFKGREGIFVFVKVTKSVVNMTASNRYMTLSLFNSSSLTLPDGYPILPGVSNYNLIAVQTDAVSSGYECQVGSYTQGSGSDIRLIPYMPTEWTDDVTQYGYACIYDPDTQSYVFDLNKYAFKASLLSLSTDFTVSLLGFTNIVDWLKTNFGSSVIRLGVTGIGAAYLSDGPSTALAMDSWHGLLSTDARRILSVSFNMSGEAISDISDTDDNPYANGEIKISALPFRAYESIYNAFYRNQFNDPFKINGVAEYNKFVTNDEQGEDNTSYTLLRRNWESDFLTTAKQTPVDGDITPLVGVTGTGTFTFQNEDGTQYNITPEYAQDGTTIIGIKTVSGTPQNNSAIRRLMDMATVGISINDFRNVNALQRWLETNLRRGYRYKDQLMSHFGVDAKFDVLDMPEFIGGVSEPVVVNQINQMSDQTGNDSGLGDFSKVLGSFAGQASVIGRSNHSISKYCDEHGFIIGIMSVTPVPNYSQLLPKMLLKENVLDYYFPEFGHIGLQPIPYYEVCPLQSYAAGLSLANTFGYQRAWYDYLSSVDEVHGDFRTTLDGFLINRVFNERPELGREFLEVDDDNMSNPFSVTDETDKILGQVYFDVVAQRPIPKYGIPRLE